jgi:glycosyltransferase involved in cell wall biosynthesis
MKNLKKTIGKEEKRLENILQVSTITIPVSPRIRYGGTERVVSYLDREYEELGYNSIVAAPGNSEVKGELLITLPKTIWPETEKNFRREIINTKQHYEEHHKIIINYLLRENCNIDIVHDHTGHLISSKAYKEKGYKINKPILITLHGQVSLDEDNERYDAWRKAHKSNNIYFNAISQSQKRDFESVGINICEVVYHGIPLNKFPFKENKSDYLFSLGRICPEKGQHLAIEIAKRARIPLIIAGELHSVNNRYYEERIKPNLRKGQIEFIGVLNDKEKAGWYKNAKGFIMPIQWPEPFGLVMIEAMACGTPVVAFDRGSVKEVIKDGETGFVIKETGNKEQDLEKMVNAVKNIGSINPEDCRKHVEKNFSIKKEAREYLSLYQNLINSHQSFIYLNLNFSITISLKSNSSE